MADWTSNILILKGPEECLHAAEQLLAGKESDLDFNNVLPMPEDDFAENCLIADKIEEELERAGVADAYSEVGQLAKRGAAPPRDEAEFAYAVWGSTNPASSSDADYCRHLEKKRPRYTLYRFQTKYTAPERALGRLAAIFPSIEVIHIASFEGNDRTLLSVQTGKQKKIILDGEVERITELYEQIQSLGIDLSDISYAFRVYAQPTTEDFALAEDGEIVHIRVGGEVLSVSPEPGADIEGELIYGEGSEARYKDLDLYLYCI